MPKSGVIFRATSPHENFEAIVEQDDRVAFFYLRPLINREAALRSCWVRNLQPAPAELEEDKMREGIAPLLPASFCKNPGGDDPLEGDHLEVLWLPTGDGAVLRHKTEGPLAVIPPWSGYRGFSGYAAGCAELHELASPLDQATEFLPRIAEADEYWTRWRTNPGLWRRRQNEFLDAYEKALGTDYRYFAIDEDQWPPKALVQFAPAPHTLLLTLGVSLRPQPQVELYTDDPAPLQRIELAMALGPNLPEPLIERLAQYVSAQTNLPWHQITFLAPGHTVPCPIFTEFAEFADFTAVLLIDEPAERPEISLDDLSEPRPRILWMIPLTQAEHNFALQHTSARLLEHFPETGPPAVFRKRPSVVT